MNEPIPHSNPKSMSNHHLLVTLPQVKPKWKRSFQSEDILPKVLICQFDSEDTKPSTTGLCPTCKINQARYTCPKCQSPYCSVACYKIHDIPSNSSGGGRSEGGGGGRCTEEFYKEKVKQVSALQVKDEANISQMRDILTRSHYDDDEDVYADGADSEKNINLTDEELMELARCGLSLNDGEDQANDHIQSFVPEDKLLNSLPLHVKLKFEQAVQRGELSHLIQEWHPFWLPKYSSDKKSEEEPWCDEPLSSSPSIDDRILAIPKLPNPKSQFRVALHHNICEVIYTTAWALRVFKSGTLPKLQVDGQAQKEDSDLSVSMTFFLYTHSRVLSGDARFESIVEVLMECTQRTSKELIRRTGMKDPIGESSFDWKVLINDMIHICKFRRLALKVLLMTGEIIVNARKELKRRPSRNKIENKLRRKQLMLASKKVEYFASWCHTHWDACCDDIVNDLESWLRDWNSTNEEKNLDVRATG